jgi:tRNA(Leu) C34 or U34 (ribose-2'-O)-methylase TrmL
MSDQCCRVSYLMLLCKMANNTLVLCKPLCFLVTKFGKLEQKFIKTASLDYYNAAEITEAKTQLVHDVIGLQFYS